MDAFIPFIHKPEKKKKEEMEPQPLYIELYPPSEAPPKKEEREEQRVIIIELM